MADTVAGSGGVQGSGAVGVGGVEALDLLKPEEQRARERFLPIARFALIDRLTHAEAWPPGEDLEARRFFRFLDYWRQQQYTRKVLVLQQAYEPFSPDSDLLMTRTYSDGERRVLQKRVVNGVEDLLRHSNYERVDPKDVEMILTKESHYGLDLTVDLKAFEELLIYYRGASTQREEKRAFGKFGRKQEFAVPIFRRLFVLFKLKPEAARVAEIMAEKRCDREEAEKIARKLRSLIPTEVQTDQIYMKLFKNMPRSDIEMIFPNTRVRFRLMDKIKLGVTSGAGLGMGAFGAAGKIALAATNPIAAAGAVAGLGGIVFRQAMNFMNQRQRYMIVMAQNLYFHSMADNRGAMIKLANRAAEEDIKEEVLLYAVLAKETVRRSDLEAVDAAIEEYLTKSFGMSADFEIADALERLIADGLVTEDADGTLHCLPPRAAAQHIDLMWDKFLDDLPDPTRGEGREIED